MCALHVHTGALLYYEEDDFDNINFAEAPRGALRLLEGDCYVLPARCDMRSACGSVHHWCHEQAALLLLLSIALQHCHFMLAVPMSSLLSDS